MTTTCDRELSTDQEAALDSAEQWWRRDRDMPFLLDGAAGTGKSEIARILAERLAGGRVQYLAPTGKACEVLRSRTGSDAVSTIHSLIYVPVGGKQAEIKALREELDAVERTVPHDGLKVAEIRARLKQLNSPGWVLKDPLAYYRNRERPALLVVDEASMVGRRLASDLETFGIPTLALGDPFQLPPVGDGPGFGGPAGASLTTIHRYGEVASLMNLATAARSGYQLPAWDGVAGTYPWAYGVANLAGFDQVLVGRNRTRWQIIHALRHFQGRPSGEPTPGDKIIVLRNDPDRGVVNGQQATVAEAQVEFDMVVITTADGDVWPVDARGFTGDAGEQDAKSDRESDLVVATFAHAITAHKAQGSQWEKVAVVNEATAFRADAQRWLYTACTRASEMCAVLDPNGLRI